MAEEENERRADRPHAGSADEMHDRQNASADALGRIFACVGEGQRLFGAEPEPGDEAAGHQERNARSERTENSKDAEQQKVELVDEAAAKAVGEFALARGAEEHAENAGAANRGDFGSRGKLG